MKIEKTLSENISVMAEGILRVIEITNQREWTTWDSFAGRPIFHKQPLRDAQKEAIEKFLTELLK